MISRKHYALAFAAFAIGLVAVIAAMAPDFRPSPIYQRLTVGPALPPPPGFHNGKTLSIEFESPAEDLNRLHWYGMLYHPLQEVDFVVRDLTQARTLVERTVHGDPDSEGNWKWRGDNDAGDRMQVDMLWRRDTAPHFPSAVVLTKKADPKTRRHEIALQGWPEKWLPDETFTVAFDAPDADFDLIDLPGTTDDRKTRVKVELFNLTTSQSMKKYTITGAPEDLGERGMKPANSAGDRLELRLRWQRVPPPALHLSGSVSRLPMQVRVDDKSIDFQPLLGLHYEWPTRQLLWLWLPVAGFAATLLIMIARGRPSHRFNLSVVTLVCLGLMAAIASCLSWQQAVGTESSHLDPDRFGQYAEQMVEWVTTDSAARRAELTASMDTWRYSWLPVTPVLIALPLLCGVPFSVTYVILAALASFGTLLLFYLLLRRYLGLGELAALTGTLLLLSHHFFLKSFAKPSTDPIGLLLVLSGLCLVCERLRIAAAGGIPGWKNHLAIAAVVLLDIGARPPGFLFAAFLVGAVLLADAWSRRQVKIVPALVDSVRLGLVPALLFGALFIGFDWIDNFQAALDSSESFQHVSTTRRLGIMSVSMLQWLPLLWLGLRRSDWKRPEIWLLGLWAVFYLALIIGVKAGFVTRMFLPMLPVPLALTALGLERLCQRGGWRRGLGISLAILAVITNIAIVTYHTSLPSLPPQNIAEWIYH